jgi:DNA-binding transcriptional regulator YhcF (GntR family)
LTWALATFHAVPDLDRADSVPAYAQLIRQVREALWMGQRHPGDQLPTLTRRLGRAREAGLEDEDVATTSCTT